MFQFFRRRDTWVRVFLAALLLLVCIMLVVTLIPGIGSETFDEAVVATIGSEKVTGTDLLRQLQQVTRGNRMPPDLLPLYAPQILERLVTEKAIQQEARRLGLTVSTEELLGQARLNPQLFPDGKFVGRDVVETQYGMSLELFQERLRDYLLELKLRRVVTAGVTVSDQEVAREFHRRNDKLRIEYALLKTADVRSTLRVTGAEVAEFFEKNLSRYQVPERRQFRLLHLQTARVKDTVSASEQELLRYYRQNRDRYRVEDRVQVSHILLKTVGKEPDEIEAVHKRAEQILDRLRKKEDFAKLARQYSDDAATTPKGGDLGWIVRGQTVPEFEEEAFSLEPGALSGVIKTQYGFHIVKVQERQRAHQQTFEQVRDQILPLITQEKAARAAEDRVQKTQRDLRENPGSFQAVAEQLGVPVLETDLLERGKPVPNIGVSPALEDALFSATLQPNEITPVVPVRDGFVVGSLVRINPAHPAELTEVRDQVEKDLRLEQAGQQVVSRMRDLAERARKLKNLKSAAASRKLAVKTSEAFTRQDSVPDVGAAADLWEAASSLSVGEIGGPVAVPDGQVVFGLLERQPAPAEELASSSDALRRELLEAKRNLAYQLFADHLKARLEAEGKLRVDEAAMRKSLERQ